MNRPIVSKKVSNVLLTYGHCITYPKKACQNALYLRAFVSQICCRMRLGSAEGNSRKAYFLCRMRMGRQNDAGCRKRNGPTPFKHFYDFPRPIISRRYPISNISGHSLCPVFQGSRLEARASEKCDCGAANWKISLAAKEIEPKSERLSLGNEN